MKKFARGLYLSLFAAAMLTASCVAGFAKGITGVELKLLFKEELFSTPQAGFKSVWDAFAKVAAEEKLTTEISKPFAVEVLKTVRYPDTPDGVYAKANYTIRQRAVMKDGKLDKGDLTLKYRTTHEGAVPEKKMADGLPKDMKGKFEGDRPGYLKGVVGTAETFDSLSYTYKKCPILTGKETVEFFAKYFPVLATLGLPKDKVIGWTSGREVVEHSTVLGVIKWGKEDVEVESSVWYNSTTKKFVVAELSWRYELKDKPQVEAMEKLFNRFQSECKDMLVPGATKVAMLSK